MKLYSREESRQHKVVELHYDLVVVGGGLSGVCCAIAAARQGVKVALIQDRSVLGGNASSEIRVWVLGATSHMGNNNRWSREGGIVDEILVENMHRNKEGNPHLFDMVLLDKVLAESNITLYLDTVLYDLNMNGRTIESVEALCSHNQTCYRLSAKIFTDASGDGVVGYLAGASYMLGAEDSSDHDEGFAQDKQEYGEQMGNTIFFYSKDTGKPVEYIAPDFALKDVERAIPRATNRGYLNPAQHGCKYWWLEYGGRLDTIYDAAQIKYELLRVVYGVWDYMKNSGNFPELANYTLEWVGSIPGKRENRRFKGLYTITQKDVIEQREHYDAVAYGGWSIDLHPADGVYSPKNGCNQWHSKGIYQIPYRAFVTEDVDNLLFSGRIISTTHVANGSTRVMCTCGHGAEAVGVAAALSIKISLLPRDYVAPERIVELQGELQRINHYIPRLTLEDGTNKLFEATVRPSSTLELSEIPSSQSYERLDFAVAQLIPQSDKLGIVTVKVRASEATTLDFNLRHSLSPSNFTPEKIIQQQCIAIAAGEQEVTIDITVESAGLGYLFLCFMANPLIEICQSDAAISGLTTVYNIKNEAVSNNGKQTPPDGIGVDAFEFWTPKRHPDSKLLAMKFSVSQKWFEPSNLLEPIYRPVVGANCWIAGFEDERPEIKIAWSSQQQIDSITLYLDTDYDNAMENVQMGHFYNTTPCCASEVEIYDSNDKMIAAVQNNYLATVNVPIETSTDTLILRFKKRNQPTPLSLFGIYIK